jgi:tetratricopeptide (TPR) repeat protein
MKKSVLQIIFLIAFCVVAWPLFKPKAAIYFSNKGVDSYTAGDINSAVAFFKKALALKVDAQLYCNLANALRAQQKYEEAITEFGHALELDSACVKAYLGLAYTYEDMEKPERSLKYFTKAQALGAPGAEEDRAKALYRYVVSLYNQAAEYYSQGDNQNAELKLKEVVRLDPTFAFAHKTLGDIKFNRGEFAESVIDYQNAIQAGLNDVGVYNIYNDIGIAYVNLEDYAQAVEYLRQANQLQPDSVDILYNLASALRDNSNFSEALGKYSMVLARNSYYPNAHNDIADICQQTGRPEEAKEQYQAEIAAVEAQSALFEEPLLKNRLAFAYCGLGEYTRALSLVNEAIALNPEYAQAYYTRSRIYGYIGEKDKSLSDLLKAKNIPGER